MGLVDTLVFALCSVLFIAGLVFVYYLTKVSQYNDASELRAKRRIEDVAYYLSKLEEQVEDSESQLHNKIDVGELETRINLSIYENVVTKVLPEKAVARRVKEEGE